MNHLHVAKGAAHAWAIIVGAVFGFLFMASLATSALAQQRAPSEAQSVFAQLAAEVRNLANRVDKLEKTVNMISDQCTASSASCSQPNQPSQDQIDQQNACEVKCKDAYSTCYANANGKSSIQELCGQDYEGCRKSCQM